MVFRDKDKQAILDNSARILSKIQIVGTDIVFSENDYISEWEYEDYRYVPENGFIGQFVERLFDGQLRNIPENINIENKELNLKVGIINGEETTWYDYGNFIVTKPGEQDTTGITSFESADYAKKFNTQYKNNNIYPCIALEQSLEACNQVGVELYTSGYVYAYIVPKNGLQQGSYSFSVDGKYYNFTINKNLKFFDTLIYNLQTGKVIQKTYDNEFNAARVEITPTIGNSSVGTLLSGKKLPFANFTNYDFVIENNQYDETTSCRDVMKSIATLAYSWVRVGVDNKVHIDFSKKNISDVDQYNDITTDDYYEQDKQQLAFGPVNKVLLGMSQVNGENVYKTSSDYTEETECAIRLYDNPLTHNEDLRRMALNGSELLFGLEYTPMSLNTIGHPWLEGDDYVSVTNLSDQTLYTYPFDRKIIYKGYIKSELSSQANTSVAQEYEFEGETLKAQRKVQIDVDKANGRITELSSNVEQLELDTTTTKTATGNPIEVEDAGNYPLESIGIEGKSEQETRSGKNLWKLPKTQTLNGVTLTNNGDGTITLNGTATANADFYAEDNSSNYTNGEKYYISSNINKSDVTLLIANYNGNTYANTMINSNQTMPFTMNTTNDKVRLIVRVLSGKTFNNTKLQIQLEKGSTETDFEPYVGREPSPSPDFPSEIKTVKGIRNLINDSLLNNGYTISGVDGSISYDASYLNNRFASEQYIKVYNGMKLFSNYQIVNYGKYDNNKNFISRVATNSATTINIDFDGYIRIGFINVNDTNLKGKCMVCEKYLPNNYVPYGSWLEQITHGKNFLNWDGNFSVSNNNTFEQNIYCISSTILTKDLDDMILSGDFSLLDSSLMRVVYSNEYPKIGETYVRASNLTSTNNIIKINKDYKYVTIMALRISSSTFDMIKNSFQLEKGNVATPYEPYKENTALIDMNKPQLFNNNMESGAINSNGIDYTDSNYIRSIDYIEVEPNTKYNISNNSDIIASNIVEYTENKTFIKRTYYSHSIFTTSANTKYIRFYTGTVANYLFQIYEGYDSYYELSSIGDTKDTFLNGLLTKRIGKVILDGSENITGNPNGTNSYNVDIGKLYKRNPNLVTLMCSHFKAVSYNNRTLNENNICYLDNNGTTYQLTFRNTTFTTLETLKTWLSNNPVTVYYILETPIEYTLPYEPLKLFKGYNYITLNDELNPSMNIEYLTDSKLNAEFTTKSEFNISNNSIRESVSAEIKELDKKTEASLELKVDEKDMMSQINAKADEINFESDKMTIKSSDFELKDGKIKSTGGTIGGIDIESNKLSCVGTAYKYTKGDAYKIYNYELGLENLTDEELTFYDINGDGEVDLMDASLIINMLNNGTMPIIKQIELKIRPDVVDAPIMISDITDINNSKGIVQLGEQSYFKEVYTQTIGIDDGSITLLENHVGKTYITALGIRTPQITQTSLESEKKNFEKLENGLDIIKNTDIYKYHLNNQEDSDKKHIGFVIGDKYNYSKEITSKNNDGVDIYSFVSVCCKAIQEQQKQIDELKSEINKLIK